jgi:hypothetical protein
MRKMPFISFVLYLLFAGVITAQTVKENWTLVVNREGSKISVELTGLEKYKDDDFYVWALEEHGSPITIESVPEKIYKTKTYFLFNKNLKRYGIIQLLYYDEKGNVLKHFSYLNDSQETSYKYSYPILPESDIELIFARCLEAMKK